jgi:hypothetical protein
VTRGAQRKVTAELEPAAWVELEHESRRLDRSYSWLMRWAWLLARDQLRKQPAPFFPARATR